MLTMQRNPLTPPVQTPHKYAAWADELTKRSCRPRTFRGGPRAPWWCYATALLVLAVTARGIALLALYARVPLHKDAAPVLAWVARDLPRLPAWLWVWGAAELAFFIYCKRLVARLQPLTPIPSLTRTRRRALFRRCIAYLADANVDPREWLRTWLCDAPFDDIAREDMENFLSWAFWGFALPGHSPPSADASAGHLSEDDRADLREMGDLFEEHACHRFPRATGAPALPLQSFTLEPLDGSYFPLCLYAATRVLNNGYRCLLLWRGFRRERAGDLHYFVKEPPASPAAEKRKLVEAGGGDGACTIFLHGIGLGLVGYFTAVSKLLGLQRRGQAGAVVLVENPQVCLHCSPRPLPIPAAVDALRAIVDRHGTPQRARPGGEKGAVFIAHSFGTCMLSWVVHELPGRCLGAVFIDPVCFLLHLKTVCYNFVYKRIFPKYGPMAILRSDLFINYAIRRQFWWMHNACFAEELPCPTIVVLAEKDEVGPVAAVEKYLRRVPTGCTADDGRPRHAELITLPGVTHGSMLYYKATMRRVFGRIGALLEEAALRARRGGNSCAASAPAITAEAAGSGGIELGTFGGGLTRV